MKIKLVKKEKEEDCYKFLSPLGCKWYQSGKCALYNGNCKKLKAERRQSKHWW